MGRKETTYGKSVARELHREPGYYDGLIDGFREAINHIGHETGLDWGKLRREVSGETE